MEGDKRRFRQLTLNHKGQEYTLTVTIVRPLSWNLSDHAGEVIYNQLFSEEDLDASARGQSVEGPWLEQYLEAVRQEALAWLKENR